ncbi:MAG: MFS transporter, partial [Gaiellaceae bacterium]
VVGLGLMTLSLLLFARMPLEGDFLVDVLPATLAVGLGAGIGFNPILLAAMSCVGPQEAGLASGVVNTSFMMGGALGLAVMVSLAASRTDTLVASGEGAVSALNSGYQIAFLVGAVFAAGAAVLGGLLLRPSEAQPHAEGEPATEAA